MQAAPPPNLVWSSSIVKILDSLDPDVRATFKYIGNANSVLHVSTPRHSGSLGSRALYLDQPATATDQVRGSARFASGVHKRIRLSQATNDSVVMMFRANTIHAGCSTSVAAVNAAYRYLLHTSPTKESIYRRGYSLNIPNIVLSATTSFPVSRSWLRQQDWTNSSDKFPGVALCHPQLKGRIVPELYPSRQSGAPMNLIIPGISSVGTDLKPTLELIATLLRPAREIAEKL